MPTYEYECKECGYRFEMEQSITDEPIDKCPKCGSTVKRLISGGMGFILEGSRTHTPRRDRGNGCRFEATGRTCCGRSEPCGKKSL